MVIDISKSDGTVVMSLKGRMDAVSSPDFDRAVEEQMANGERHFMINLSDLEYISSAGLQSLLAAAKRLEQTEGEISLSNLKGAVREVFEISGFDTLFPILDS
jgi:anti-anti-sigma factor